MKKFALATEMEYKIEIDEIENRRDFLSFTDSSGAKGVSRMDFELAKPFIKATRDVLSMMAMTEVVPGTPYVKKNNQAVGDVTGIIGMSGNKSGTFSITFSRECAVYIVRQMLGDEIGDVVQDAQDAVGEITNMISGQARIGLEAFGVSMVGTTPSIVLGDNHTISHQTKAPVMAVPFKCAGGEFTIEFCFE